LRPRVTLFPYTTLFRSAWSRSLTPERALDLGVERMETPLEVARAADIVSVHVALKPDTRMLIGPDFFQAMRDGAYFINTSRGEVDRKSTRLNSSHQIIS